MNSLGHRLLWPVTLVVALVFLAACAKRVELEVNAEPTYIGPQVADSTNIRLTDSWGWDYKVSMTCTFTNSGGGWSRQRARHRRSGRKVLGTPQVASGKSRSADDRRV